jgi:hypothetical protein
MEVVSHRGTDDVRAVEALERAGEVDVLEGRVVGDVQELGHLDGDSLLVVGLDVGVDHADIVKDARNVELVVFLRLQRLRKGNEKKKRRGRDLEVVQELAEGEVALLDLPALRPQGHGELVVDLGDRARLRFGEQDGREGEIDPGVLVEGEILKTEEDFDHFDRDEPILEDKMK